MLGKGSINHNSRKFIADNVSPTRTPNNIEFANQDIKQAYHQLFDDALTKYNAKQTRKIESFQTTTKRFVLVNKKNIFMKSLFKSMK